MYAGIYLIYIIKFLPIASQIQIIQAGTEPPEGCIIFTNWGYLTQLFIWKCKWIQLFPSLYL